MPDTAIELEDGTRLSAILDGPAAPAACYVLAHGAGAGMAHPFMKAVAEGLAARGFAVLRFQFAYMEKRQKRPDPPRLAHSAVRAAVAKAAETFPGLPLFAGGRSFGGRMTSQAEALEHLPGVAGLAFLGFPLHPAGRPSTDRAAHLADIAVPMVFLQGTNDALAELGLLEGVCGGLGSRARLHLFADADHAFHVPARSGRKDADIREELLDALAGWMGEVIAGGAGEVRAKPARRPASTRS